MKTILRQSARVMSVFLFVWICLETSRPLALPAFADLQNNARYQGVLRLHVIANSDSDEDQRVKLLVRDALLEKFALMETLSDAENVVLSNGAGVLETVEAVLHEEGCDYGAQLRFGVMEFPEKSYGDTVYPEGDYEALKVELGNASGQNWWCVLFPPICLIDVGVKDIEGSDEIVFESDIAGLFNKAAKNAGD